MCAPAERNVLAVSYMPLLTERVDERLGAINMLLLRSKNPGIKPGLRWSNPQIKKQKGGMPALTKRRATPSSPTRKLRGREA